MSIDSIFSLETKVINAIFVGSPLNFSETVLKISNGEMECVQFTRLDSLCELARLEETATSDQRASVRNIIIDETMMDIFCTRFSALQQAYPGAQFALAFRETSNALELMARTNEVSDLRRVSLLPMNLEVDCWLSVLRLLICGGHYVPSELIVSHHNGGQQPSQAACAINRTARQPVDQASAAQPEDVQQESEASAQIRLTDRELQVLRSAAEGKPNKIIAEELCLSQHTIKLHMHHLMAKLGVHNRTEAAIWFFDHQNEVSRP